MRLAGLIVLIWVAVGLLSCGQKGPLQIPSDSRSWVAEAMLADFTKVDAY